MRKGKEHERRREGTEERRGKGNKRVNEKRKG